MATFQESVPTAPEPAAVAPAEETSATTPAPAGHQQLVPRTLLANGLEFSVHRCPRTLLRELGHVFPDEGLCPSRSKAADAGPTVLAVPTCQHSTMDLVRWGDDVEKE